MLCKRTDKRKEFNSSVLLPRGLYSSKIFSVQLFIIVAFSSNHLSAVGSFSRKIGHFHRSRRRTSTCRRYWHNGARGFAFAHRGRLGYGIFLAYICFRFPISVNLFFFCFTRSLTFPRPCLCRRRHPTACYTTTQVVQSRNY